jgi:hypothetical protein
VNLKTTMKKGKFYRVHFLDHSYGPTRFERFEAWAVGEYLGTSGSGKARCISIRHWCSPKFPNNDEISTILTSAITKIESLS